MLEKSYQLSAVILPLLLLLTASVTVHADKQIFGDIFESLSLQTGAAAAALQQNEHKCQREVPAIFFQTAKAEAVRGNGSTIYYHRLEVCCEGYTHSPYNWSKCVPDCSLSSPNNCRNGFCRAPNECECFEEFVRNDRGECVHTCPIACQHGRCYLNGTCACNAGYTLDPQTRKFCRAECPKGCGNHQWCAAPGKCVCMEGYKRTEQLGCQPVCTPDCGHGKCIGPNRCECFSGYMKRPQRNVCEAECYFNCENGFCESRFKCQCRDGYKYDVNTTSCLPDCGDDCQNGVCIDPGVCRCFDGYELRGTTCEPKCQGGCGYYGKCIEPNVCGCGASKQHCQQGSCDANGHCVCAAGLTRFIDKCVDPARLEGLVGGYEQRDYYNRHLKEEYEGLIGRMFQYAR